MLFLNIHKKFCLLRHQQHGLHVKMCPNYTKKQVTLGSSEEDDSGGSKSWFGPAECTFPMLTAPSCWRQHCTAEHCLDSCLFKFGCALLSNRQHMEFGSRKPSKQTPVLGSSEIFCLDPSQSFHPSIPVASPIVTYT